MAAAAVMVRACCGKTLLSFIVYIYIHTHYPCLFLAKKKKKLFYSVFEIIGRFLNLLPLLYGKTKQIAGRDTNVLVCVSICI